MHNLLPLLILLVLALVSLQVSGQPYKTLVAPIDKDTDTSLYSITLNHREHYLLDINAPYLWYVCPNRPQPTVACSAPQCIQGRTYLSKLCPNSDNLVQHGYCTCMVTPVNPLAKSCATSQLTYNNVVVAWTNGKYPTVNKEFNHVFMSCAPKSLLQSLPKSAIGVAGLSWSPLALPTQFAPPVTKKFALCLPSQPRARGVLFFGDGPYYIMPSTQFDAMSVLSYTPLLKQKNSAEYYIGLKGISINGKPSKFKHGAFEFDSYGHGGVKLSTVARYTTLRSDIFKVLLDDFSEATRGIPRAKKVSPFGLCLKSSALGYTRVGLHAPQIDLKLEGGKTWTIIGANSMKQVGNDVACLAFIDGGKTAQEAVVIGSYQMENNFLLFDLAASRLGFSSSLSNYRASCDNFNVTDHA